MRRNQKSRRSSSNRAPADQCYPLRSSCPARTHKLASGPLQNYKSGSTSMGWLRSKLLAHSGPGSLTNSEFRAPLVPVIWLLIEVRWAYPHDGPVCSIQLGAL